jgi:hypothetical protein
MYVPATATFNLSSARVGNFLGEAAAVRLSSLWADNVSTPLWERAQRSSTATSVRHPYLPDRLSQFDSAVSTALAILTISAVVVGVYLVVQRRK